MIPLLVLIPLALAAEPATEAAAELAPGEVRYPTTLSYALGFAGTELGSAGLADLRFLVNLGHGVSVDLGSRQVDLAELHVSGLTAGVRWTTPLGPHVRLAFAHHHETPLAIAEDQPFWVGTGTLDATQHRSGGEAAVGWDVPLRWGKKARWGWTSQLSYSSMLDPDGPRAYATIDTGLSIDLGRARPL